MCGVRFARSRVKTLTLALRAESGALILSEAGLSLCSGDVDLPIGQIDSVRCQLLIVLRLFSDAHGTVRLFHRQRRAAPQVRIGLQLRELIARLRGAVRLDRCRRAGGEQHGSHGGCDQRPAEHHASMVDSGHGLSPELRCISSTRVPLLRFISSFTAVALTSAVLAEASSASTRDSLARRSANIIRCSETALSADASLVRASANSPEA